MKKKNQKQKNQLNPPNNKNTNVPVFWKAEGII